MWNHEKLLEFHGEKHKIASFHHLMKTAGSSIQEALFTEADPEFHVSHTKDDVKRLLKLISDGYFLKPAKYAVAGHMTDRVFRKFPEHIPHLRYTIFREPFSRFVSEASFRRLRHRQLDMTFSDYLEQLPANPICFFLGAETTEVAYQKLQQRFHYIGFTNELQKVFGTVQYLMGYNGTRFSSNNVVPKGLAFKPTLEERAIFEEKHAEDIELYNIIDEEFRPAMNAFHSEYCPEYLPNFEYIIDGFTRSFTFRDAPDAKILRDQFERLYNQGLVQASASDERFSDTLFAAGIIEPTSIFASASLVSKLGPKKLESWLGGLHSYWSGEQRDPLNVFSNALEVEMEKI